jgi:hypothetical protein
MAIFATQDHTLLQEVIHVPSTTSVTRVSPHCVLMVNMPKKLAQLRLLSALIVHPANTAPITLKES